MVALLLQFPAGNEDQNKAIGTLLHLRKTMTKAQLNGRRYAGQKVFRPEESQIEN